MIIQYINLVNLLKYHFNFMTAFQFYLEGARIQENACLITYALWNLHAKGILTITHSLSTLLRWPSLTLVLFPYMSDRTTGRAYVAGLWQQPFIKDPKRNICGRTEMWVSYMQRWLIKNTVSFENIFINAWEALQHFNN